MYITLKLGLHLCPAKLSTIIFAVQVSFERIKVIFAESDTRIGLYTRCTKLQPCSAVSGASPETWLPLSTSSIDHACVPPQIDINLYRLVSRLTQFRACGTVCVVVRRTWDSHKFSHLTLYGHLSHLSFSPRLEK